MRRLIFLLFSMTPLSAAEWPFTLHWTETLTLSTPLSGKIDNVKVETGDMVKQGQLLATLDARLHQAEVKRARSILSRNKLTFEEALRSYERAKELYDRTVLSTTDFQQTELQHAVAEANYHQSQADLTKARTNLEYTRIVAPVDGMIIERLVHPGETINNELQVQPMLRLAKTDDMLARAWLPAKDIQKLSIGQEIELKIQEMTLKSKITSIGAINRETQKMTEYAVDMNFTPPTDKRLLPGMRGQAILP